MKEIDYAGFDNRMQSKEQKKMFLRKQPFRYWSEMIHTFHIRDEMSPTDIRNHVLNLGYTGKLTVEAIRGVLQNMGVAVKRGTKVFTKVKKIAPVKLKRPCRRCGKREIPPEHSLFCYQCYSDNCRRSGGENGWHIGGSQYLF